jgi:hypothetical protein
MCCAGSSVAKCVERTTKFKPGGKISQQRDLLLDLGDRLSLEVVGEDFMHEIQHTSCQELSPVLCLVIKQTPESSSLDLILLFDSFPKAARGRIGESTAGESTRLFTKAIRERLFCSFFVTRNKFFSKQTSCGLSCKMGACCFFASFYKRRVTAKRVLRDRINVVNVEQVAGRLTDIPLATSCHNASFGIYPRTLLSRGGLLGPSW